MTTRRGVSLLDRADPYLATVRSVARVLPPELRDAVELARYQLYRALDRYTDPEKAEGWLVALEASVAEVDARQRVPEALQSALDGLRRVVRVDAQ